MTKWTRLSDLSTQVPLIYESNFFPYIDVCLYIKYTALLFVRILSKISFFFRLPSVVFRKRVQRYNLFPNYQNFSHFFSKKLNFFSWPLPHSLFILGAREDFNQNNPFKALLRVFKLTLFWHSLKGKKMTFYNGFNIFLHLKGKKKLKIRRIWYKKRGLGKCFRHKTWWDSIEIFIRCLEFGFDFCHKS